MNWSDATGRADDLELAWAAGLFEGEGWMSNVPWKDDPVKRTRQIGLSMTDEDVVRRFHRVMGVGSVKRRDYPNDPWKPIWIWQCWGWRRMVGVLERLRPFLGERRQAQVAKFLTEPPKLEAQCRNGHMRTRANTYVDPSGSRNCRVCKRESARRHAEARYG